MTPPLHMAGTSLEAKQIRTDILLISIDTVVLRMSLFWFLLKFGGWQRCGITFTLPHLGQCLQRMRAARLWVGSLT